MIRSFLPIGQGGFAVEQFSRNKINIVFDCGTKTNIGKVGSQKLVEALICRTFEPGEQIHMVFVSHLHDDHINGLPFLLRYCKVKRIYLPYLTPVEQAITIFLLQETMDIDSLRLFRSLITGNGLRDFDIDTRVVYVMPPEQNENISNSDQATIMSGESIEIGLHDARTAPEWEFIPYCYEGDARSKDFKALLLEQGITSDDIQRFLSERFWEKDELFWKIKQIYTRIENDLNFTTMVVYSGAKSKYIRQYHCAGNNCEISQLMNCWNLEESGCLYTGDYRASSDDEWEDLKRAYDKVWDRIGIFTLPHHGSSNNYNEEFSAQYATIIINAGYTNHYGHPSRKVLCNLIENKCRFFWVNEHIGSRGIFRTIPFSL